MLPSATPPLNLSIICEWRNTTHYCGREAASSSSHTTPKCEGRFAEQKARISPLPLLLTASAREEPCSPRLSACGKQNCHSVRSQPWVLTRLVSSLGTAGLLLPHCHLATRNKRDFCSFPWNEVRIPDQTLELLASMWRNRIQPLGVFQRESH